MDPQQRPLSLSGAPDGPLARGRNRVGVALFHGFTSGPVSVTPWARALAAAGADVDVPLLPGHGTRWEDLEHVSAAQWREAARRTVDALLSTHERVFVAGLSMGGALALDAAAHRRVAGAVVVNPGLRFASPAAPLAGWLKYIVRTVTPIANDTMLPEADERAYPRTPVAGVQQVGRLQAEARRGLPRITAPVLAFRSTTDHVVPASSITTLARGLAPELLTLRPLHHSYHVATLDTDAPIIHAESIAFLTGLLNDSDLVGHHG
ncbi:alpha/beta hydrolase [Microbacterium sp. A93]|uniref:alpha/beta hydrolase n=1 Tax=Microbacterium sp. A93 TaxID=3450716 RepID=UPI003F436E69